MSDKLNQLVKTTLDKSVPQDRPLDTLDIEEVAADVTHAITNAWVTKQLTAADMPSNLYRVDL